MGRCKQVPKPISAPRTPLTRSPRSHGSPWRPANSSLSYDKRLIALVSTEKPPRGLPPSELRTPTPYPLVAWRVATHNCVSTGLAVCGRLDNATNTDPPFQHLPPSPSSSLPVLSSMNDEYRVSSNRVTTLTRWSIGWKLEGSRETQLVGKISARPWPLLYGLPCHRYIVSSGRIRVRDRSLWYPFRKFSFSLSLSFYISFRASFS